MASLQEQLLLRAEIDDIHCRMRAVEEMSLTGTFTDMFKSAAAKAASAVAAVKASLNKPPTSKEAYNYLHTNLKGATLADDGNNKITVTYNAKTMIMTFNTEKKLWQIEVDGQVFDVSDLKDMVTQIQVRAKQGVAVAQQQQAVAAPFQDVLRYSRFVANCKASVRN